MASANDTFFENRKEELSMRQSQKDILVYPHKFSNSITINELREKYNFLDNGETHIDKHSISGRIIRWREQSKKLTFSTIRGNGYEIQVIFNFAYYQGDFSDITSILRRGDIIGCTGVPHRTRRGELSLLLCDAKLLSPCLRMLPEPGGLSDQELRYRKRYIDGIVNHDEFRRIFTERAKIITYVRKFFQDRDFIEVETPTINSVAGGANAKPFETKINATNKQAVLRISPELYLKQLVVSGFDKVFEIGRQFRNEGLDLTHNPEFTSIETYEAYSDYYDLWK